MPFLQTVRDRAALVIAILATIVAVGLSPFASGLLGAAVLYVVFVRPYRWLERVSNPGIAATAVLVAALLLIALPVTWLIGMLIHQAPDALHQLQNSGVYARLGRMRVGALEVGPELAKASGTLLSWFSSQLCGRQCCCLLCCARVPNDKTIRSVTSTTGSTCSEKRTGNCGPVFRRA